MSSSLPTVTKPKPEQKRGGFFNWFFHGPNVKEDAPQDTSRAEARVAVTPPSPPPQRTTPTAAPAPKPSTTAPSAAVPAAPAAAAPKDSMDAAPSAPRDADQVLPQSPQEMYEKALDEYRAKQKAANEAAYTKYEDSLSALNNEFPDQEKFWMDKAAELKKQPLESKNMNPFLAFAAAMGAPEQTSKTVATNNDAIARERLTRQQQYAEMEAMAVKGRVEDAMRQGKWKEALSLLKVQKEVDANLEDYKRRADELYLQSQGNIQSGLMDKKNAAMLESVKLRMQTIIGNAKGDDSKELAKIFAQVRAGMSSGGLQFGSEAEIMQRVANVYNAIHYGEGKIFNPDVGGIVNMNQSQSANAGSGAVSFNANVTRLGSASTLQPGSPPNMATYKMDELKILWEMPTKSVSNEERAALQAEYRRRRDQNNKDIGSGANKTFE